MRIQLEAIRTNVSRNFTMVTNMSSFRTIRLPRVRSNNQLWISYPLSPFSDWGTKIVFDLEAVEEEGPEESTYPKLALSELGF